MKTKILTLCIIVLLLMLALPSTANAWRQLDTCRLHAYVPTRHGIVISATGAIDTCGGATGEAHMRLQVCEQIKWQGRWRSQACRASGTYFSPGIRMQFTFWERASYWRRTLVWADINGKTGYYTSSARIL